MRSTSRSPRVPAILGAAALLTASLAGCTAIPGIGGCEPVVHSGEASKLVTASGAPGSISDVDFPTPLIVMHPEASVLLHGDGALVTDGAQVDITTTTHWGPDGTDATGSQPSRRVSAGLESDDLGDAIMQAVVCSHVGDRIALVATVAQAYGSGAAGGNADLDDTALVMIIDVTAAYLGKADGMNQLPLDGMPTVVTAVDGTPGISVLLQEPPATTRSSVIKAGSGAVVKDDANLVAHASVWAWPAESGKQPNLLDSTWSKHQAATFALSSDSAGLPPDVIEAVVGERIGSQILVVVPPDEDTTQGSDDTTAHIYVVDLLGLQK